MRYQGNFGLKVKSSKFTECETEAVEIGVLVLVSRSFLRSLRGRFIRNYYLPE